MTIRLFRLITGEDIITTVKETLSPNNDQVIMEKPIHIMIEPQGDKMGISFVPYMPMIEGDVIVNKSSIISEGNPEPNLAQEYNTRFGSGIVIAGANSVPNIKV